MSFVPKTISLGLGTISTSVILDLCFALLFFLQQMPQLRQTDFVIMQPGAALCSN